MQHIVALAVAPLALANTTVDEFAEGRKELAIRRRYTHESIAQLQQLLQSAAQLSYPGLSDTFARAFVPAPRFAPGSARVPIEFTERRGNKNGRCSTFRGSHACRIEHDEWVMSTAFITPEHTILELGARYGTTSCVLAQLTNNSGNVVSVEPDPTVHDDLLYNRDAHRCNVHVVKGMAGPIAKPQKMNPRMMNGYGRTSVKAERDDMPADTLDFREIEARIGRRFNAMLVDCEGCITAIVETGILEQLEVILMEEDGELKEKDYARVHAQLRRAGFARRWRAHDTFNPKLQWSALLEHSGWVRVAPPSIDCAWRGDAGTYMHCTSKRSIHPLAHESKETNALCQETKARHGYSEELLNCFRNSTA